MAETDVGKLVIPPSVADNLPSMVRDELRKLSAQRQQEFLEEYQRKAKSVGICYLLWLLLGFHYIYLRKWGIQFLYWITGAGLVVWAIVDIFRIPGMIRDYNKDVAVNVLRDMKIMMGN